MEAVLDRGKLAMRVMFKGKLYERQLDFVFSEKVLPYVLLFTDVDHVSNGILLLLYK